MADQFASQKNSAVVKIARLIWTWRLRLASPGSRREHALTRIKNWLGIRYLQVYPITPKLFAMIYSEHLKPSSPKHSSYQRPDIKQLL